MEELLKILTNALFDGAYRATGFILGPQQLKAFVRSFGEVSLESILLHSGKNVSGSDPQAAATSWAGVEAEIGFHGGDHTKIEMNADEVEATYSDCIFAESCGAILADLIKQNLVATEDLPCLRCSLTSAAIAKATGKKTKYKMLQHAPGFRCRCSLKII